MIKYNQIVLHVSPYLSRLTPKQKRLVKLRIENPDMSNSEIIRRAGYGKGVEKSSGQKVLHSAKVQAAISEILAQTLSEYDKDPREWVKRSLIKHAVGASEASVSDQIRATELLGKLTGEFSERIEVDPGEYTRKRLAQDLLSRLEFNQEA